MVNLFSRSTFVKHLLGAIIFILIGTATQAQSSSYCLRDGDTLKIGNSLIERAFLWNNGALKTIWATNKVEGTSLKSDGSVPDFSIGGLSFEAKDATCEIVNVDATPIRKACLEARISYKVGSLEIRRTYRIFDDAAAVACETWLKGSVEKTNNEPLDAVLDRVSFSSFHWRGKAVEFWDVTDENNNLVAEKSFISYHRKNYSGNLLLADDNVSGKGFFFLKESPCSSVQLSYPGKDFVVNYGIFQVTGCGLANSDITPNKWVKAYTCVFGVSKNEELTMLQTLRNYQKTSRIHKSEDDEMIMMNTWGDRSQDVKINESFCLNEIERAAKLGITHFQLDDGWQKGKSPNSAISVGSFMGIWDNPDYWTPDPEKYPSGLASIVAKGEELGIKVGLWFNPSYQDEFAHWRDDANTIINLYKKYGIRVFKIDGLIIPSKKAEENLYNFYNTVLKETDNKVLFNLDVTAGKRGGYNMYTEYGNVFLENRYTDWHNYFPYMTLRNVWQLSKYIPIERLQVEFLNKWRNQDIYGDEDPFAPAKYSFAYIFATAMAGQPLAWFEAENLPEEAFSIAPIVKDYRKVMADFHSGVILPIGDEPSGRSWTGFQSIVSEDGKNGYLIIYREDNPSDEAEIKTWLPEGGRITLTPIVSGFQAKKVIKCKIGDEGRVKIAIPEKNDFVMYQYSIN